MGLKLFDGSDGSDDNVGDISKIEINKEFARRYEHNKKREDLQRLEELKKKGIVEDSDPDSDSDKSSDESEEDLVNSNKIDLDFFNALIKVKNQDPVLKDKDGKLFESETEDENEEEEEEEEENEVEEEEEGRGKRGKKEKPMYLKDVAAKHLIEEGPEFEDEEGKLGMKSYSEEQEELRKAFLDAAEKAVDGEDGEFLKEKENKNGVDEDDDDGCEIQKKLDQYFGEDDNLDENEKFLKDYFRNKMWIDDTKSDKPLDDEGFGFSDDEKEIEKQEDYEREYNFRYEENAGDRVLGHSRFVEDSVRKKTNARKLQRKRKEERMALAEAERKEELKHLKNLKKKEMNEKLRKIRETAGIGESEVCLLNENDLEEEFDPEEYDRKMKEAFNDDYYDANDLDPEFGSDGDEDGGDIEKPDFEKEDELLELPKGWDDVCGSSDGFLAAWERNLKLRKANEGHHEQVEEEETVPEEGNQKKKRKLSSLVKEVRDKELDEYFKLDYEDTIGDLKTRFKYRGVKKQRYGLSAEEILLVDDKELNQYVSLKKLAPYREKEWKVPRIKTYQQQLRNKSLLEAEILNSQKTGKKTSRTDRQKLSPVVGATENGKAQLEESDGDRSELSRRSRRRRRQAALKLSHSRLMAYGKIPSKPKSKKKH